MENFYSKNARYFINFISIIKKDSGILRWNSLCEDILKLYNMRYPNNRPYDEIEFWKIIFEPDTIPSNNIQSLEEKCKDTDFSSFLFYLLYAFTDPPAAWWNEQFLSYR